MTDPRSFYTDSVWPQVPEALKTHLAVRCPDVRLLAEPGFVPLSEIPVCMVVGLTGTGKSTTLAQLAALRGAGAIRYHDDIPERRELADVLILPTAQVIAGEAVEPVKDRARRFELTHRFAQDFDPGGSAAAYGWLYYHWDGHTPLLSDGLRGPGEIAYALAHYPHWRICELWVDPVTRLRRLSSREDRFDYLAHTEAAADLDFLPDARRSEVLLGLESGEITAKAIATARAEARNYGAEPYDAANHTARYRCLKIDELNPLDVAYQVGDFLGDSFNDG